MTLMKDSRSVCTCCTSSVGNDIQDRQLEREYLLYTTCIYKNNKVVKHRRRQRFRFMADMCKDMQGLCTMGQAVFKVSLELARAAVLRSVGQIAPVCGTIPCPVILCNNDKLQVDLADSSPTDCVL